MKEFFFSNTKHCSKANVLCKNNEFYKIQTRVQLTEMEVQVIHCYLMGLRPNVRNLVELQPCWMLSDAVRLAMKVENQQRWSNNHSIKSAWGPNQLEYNRRQGDVKKKSVSVIDDLPNSRSNTHFQARNQAQGHATMKNHVLGNSSNSLQSAGCRIICYKYGNEGHKSFDC